MSTRHYDGNVTMLLGVLSQQYITRWLLSMHTFLRHKVVLQNICNKLLHIVLSYGFSVVPTYFCPWNLNLHIAIVLLCLRVHYSVEIKHYKSRIRIMSTPLGGGYIIFAFFAVRCPASDVRRHAWFPLI